MVEQDPTRIGQVLRVRGAAVTVALDPDLAGTSPIFRGRLHAVGQIGSLVRVPQGALDLVATVVFVGITEGQSDVAPTSARQPEERYLQVQLLGQIDRGTGTFQRGVGSYPGLDDPVHFATPEELKAVFPGPGDENLPLGRLASAEEIPVCVEAKSFVVRHAAVVGSTGSGKTSAVAATLQGFVKGGWDAANIVVVDPHGEYSRAMDGYASVRSVLGSGANRLRVPFWAMAADDIVRVFCGSWGEGTFYKRFVELVTQHRREFVRAANWLSLEPSAVTADTPVPFDIREVWYQLDAENNMTLKDKGNPDTVCKESEGNASELRSATFTPYGAGGRSPHQGPYYGVHNTLPNQLRLGLLDPQLRAFLSPEGETDGTDPMVEVVQSWLGDERPVSVLDFSGVPAIAADLAIGVVLNLIFEISLRCDFGGPGIGRPCPVLVVLEEAHRYLGSEAGALTRQSVNRIAREGRKYGVGIMLVSQRPTELPSTALAQCGTLVALRLSNSGDQGAIRAALPDEIGGLAAALPSLRTGEAIVSGESMVLPARIRFDMPEPRPKADDPSLEAWRGKPAVPDVAPALMAWRGTHEVADD